MFDDVLVPWGVERDLCLSLGEQYLNSQLTDHVQQFYREQDLLAQAKQHYRQCSTGITEKSQQLAELTAELTRIKEEMDETGQNVTDGGWREA